MRIIRQRIFQAGDLSEKKYYNAFWDKKNSADDYRNYVSFDDWRLCTTGLQDYFSSKFMEFTVEGNVGLDRLFYYDDKDMQLCPLLDTIPGNLSGKARESAVMHKIAEMNKAGNLYAYVPEEPDDSLSLQKGAKTEQLYKLSYKNNEVRNRVPNLPEPEKPGFIKRLLHSLRPSLFKDEFDRYEKAKFQKEYFDYRLSTPPTGGFIDPKKAKQEQDAKAAKSEPKKTTREELERKIAKGIVEAQKVLPINDYLKVRDLTEERLLSSPEFREYLAAPDVQQRFEKKLQGDNSISTNSFCRGFMEHAAKTANKAPQEAPQKSQAQKDVVKQDIGAVLHS